MCSRVDKNRESETRGKSKDESQCDEKEKEKERGTCNCTCVRFAAAEDGWGRKKKRMNLWSVVAASNRVCE